MRNYFNQLKIVPANIYLDTNQDNYLIEYSACKKYIRIISLDDKSESRWRNINSASVVYNKNYQTIFFIRVRVGDHPIHLKFNLLK